MTPVPGNPLKGVLLVSAAVFLFALGDTVTKHLTMRLPVSEVVAVRYVINALLLALFLWPRHRAALWRTDRTALVLLRGGCLAGASLTMGLALRVMPVGETVAIVYIAPFLVMLLAGPILGEKVSLAGWIGVTVGFAGVLLIVRPGAGLDPWGVTLAVVNACFGTAYHLLTRVLARTETTIAMLFHTAMVGSVVFCLMSWVGQEATAPSGADWLWMAALGVLSTAGHFLFTAAYREAPASLLAPVNYMHLVWAGLLGVVAFGHVPDAVSIAGMAAVALAGMVVAVRAQRGA
jgi:drug/metabolite transporter (DMT)-like permease